MGDYRDDDYWRHRYAQIDREHVEEQRKRENEITRLRLEGARLEGEISRSKSAVRLKESYDRFREEKEHDLNKIARCYAPKMAKDRWH